MISNQNIKGTLSHYYYVVKKNSKYMYLDDPIQQSKFF